MSSHCRILAALLVSLTLSACATHRAGKKGEQSGVEATDAQKATAVKVRPVGTISMVNGDLGFVLIDSPEGLVPGTALKAHAPEDQRETATLSVSPEQARPFFIAEITSGAPRPGDWVAKP